MAVSRRVKFVFNNNVVVVFSHLVRDLSCAVLNCLLVDSVVCNCFIFCSMFTVAHDNNNNNTSYKW